MQVDRSRFLLLTASLAAAACNQPAAALSPDTGGVDPARSKDADTPTRAGSSGDPAVWLEIEPGTEDRPTRADACDNTVGTPAPCALRPPAGHCESFDMTERLCANMSTILQPRAAEAAVACMASVSGTPRLCEWDLWGECVAAGTQNSCVEASTGPECDSISSQCGGSLDIFSCQQTLSAVRPQHRNSVASCVREFCEVSYCVTDLALY
jgi:hypothetical protein